MQNPILSSLAWLLLAASLPVIASDAASQAQPADAPQRDGQRDFDWEIGRWRTELRRLAKPLSGSNEWLEYRGTSTVRGVLGGRANLVELELEGAAGRIEGASLRLYAPQARQWSLNFANIRNGLLTAPVQGEFRNGRGEFYGADELDGRAILVRFVIIREGADKARFEQAFSGDGGRTWETNWVAVDSRIPDN